MDIAADNSHRGYVSPATYFPHILTLPDNRPTEESVTSNNDHYDVGGPPVVVRSSAAPSSIAPVTYHASERPVRLGDVNIVEDTANSSNDTELDIANMHIDKAGDQDSTARVAADRG